MYNIEFNILLEMIWI